MATQSQLENLEGVLHVVRTECANLGRELPLLISFVSLDGKGSLILRIPEPPLSAPQLLSERGRLTLPMTVTATDKKNVPAVFTRGETGGVMSHLLVSDKEHSRR
jgi:hypothetical protein